MSFQPRDFIETSDGLIFAVVDAQIEQTEAAEELETRRDGAAAGLGEAEAAVAATAERRREAAGRSDSVIPMRPDHGHLLIDDQK